jgi:hypothetical protein
MPLVVHVATRLVGRQVAPAIPPPRSLLHVAVVLLNVVLLERAVLDVPGERVASRVEEKRVVGSPEAMRVVLRAEALP